MKKITLLFFLLFQIHAYTQAPAIQWQKNYGGSGFDSAFAIKPTVGGGFIAVGQTKSNDHDVTDNHIHVGQPTYDMWAIKTDASGAITWQRALGGSEGDAAMDVAQTADGGYIVTGSTYSNDGDGTGNSNGAGFIVIKLNSLGVTQWHRCYGGSGMEEAYSISQTTDGGYIIAGYTSSTNGDLELTTAHLNDLWILKLLENGDIHWQQRLGGSSNLENALSVKQTSNGGYIVAGASSSNDFDVPNNNGLQDFCLFRLSPTGSMLWQKSYGGNGHDVAYDVIETLDGQFVVTGNTTSSNMLGHHGLSDGIVMRLNSSGELIWQRILGGSGEDFLFKIRQTADGGFVAAGQTNSTNDDVSGLHGNQIDGWLLKLSSSGELLWQKPMGGNLNDALYSVEIVSDTILLTAGNASSTDGDLTANLGNQDFWVAKLDTSLATQSFISHALAVAPNPSSKTIQLTLPGYEHFDSIKIIDSSGKVLLTQTEKSNVVNIVQLQSGLYLIEAIADAKVYRTKFLKN